MTGLVQSKSLGKTVFMSHRHAQYTANLQHSQQSTLNTTVTPVVFTAQCCCKILSNEHANCPYRHALIKMRQNSTSISKTNAQRPQTAQKEQCMTVKVQLTETIVLTSHASRPTHWILRKLAELCRRVNVNLPLAR